MPKRSSKKPKAKADLNQTAYSIVEQATNSAAIEKNPAAVELGRLGGLKGGRARAESLTALERKNIAKKAAIARWKRKRSGQS